MQAGAGPQCCRMKSLITTDQAPAAIGPYAQAVSSGGFLFTSGQLPTDPATGDFVPGGISEQTEQVLRNIQAVLAAAGADLSHVVKTTVFLKDMNDFAAMNEVYTRIVPAPYPARSTIEVARLPKDARVEIETVVKLP